MYARQLAWFHSAPIDKKRKVVSGETEPDTPLTRGEKIVRNGGTPLMPDVGAAAYLVDYWHDVGLVSVGGMGPAPLTSVELMAWQEGRGFHLQPWEFHILREMSRAYLAQAHASEKPECPPPFGDPVNEFDREVVSKKVANAFKAFIQAKRAER